MEILSSLFYFIIVIGVLVVVHEFGHFIAARLSGIRTEVFSIGMGYRLFGFNKKHGFTFGKLAPEEDIEEYNKDYYCDYRLSLLPIGGYVKIAGMVDESMDADYATSEAKPWEFRSKNTLQKVFVISAGVIMNTLLTILIFSGISFYKGESINAATTIGYVKKNSVAEKIGFRQNDKVLAINNARVNNWNDIYEGLAFKNVSSKLFIKVGRGSTDTTLEASSKEIMKSLADKKDIGIQPDNMVTYIKDVLSTYPAARAGIKDGDTIVSINKTPVRSFYQMIDILKENKNTNVWFQWKRNNKILADSIKPDENGLIGVMLEQAYKGQIIHRSFNLIEATSFGFNKTIESVQLFISSIYQLIKGNVSVKQSLGGPILIASTASKEAELGIPNFLTFMALLSISLAIINIIPFPALDGGHLVFILVEGIIRKEISVKIKMAFQQAGMIILLLFLALIFYNDLTR